MGGTIIKKSIVLEKDGLSLDAEICSWETTLWRIKVIGTLYIGAKSIEFEYEVIDRSITITKTHRIENEITLHHEHVLIALSDLAIIRAINPDYYPDALNAPDLNLHRLMYLS